MPFLNKKAKNRKEHLLLFKRKEVQLVEVEDNSLGEDDHHLGEEDRPLGEEVLQNDYFNPLLPMEHDIFPSSLIVEKEEEEEELPLPINVMPPSRRRRLTVFSKEQPPPAEELLNLCQGFPINTNLDLPDELLGKWVNSLRNLEDRDLFDELMVAGNTLGK